MLEFAAFAQSCIPDADIQTLQQIVEVESSFNQYAIGVVGAQLSRQPNNRKEAIATVEWLEKNGYNYSLGYGQVNKANFTYFGLDSEKAFDGCLNLKASLQIYNSCLERAKTQKERNNQEHKMDAFSCYYSNNFVTGYKDGYVFKVMAAGEDTGVELNPPPIPLKHTPPQKHEKEKKKSRYGGGFYIEKLQEKAPDKPKTEDQSADKTALLF